MLKRKTTHWVEDPRQLKELVGAVRNEIRLAFELLGEATIAELGTHLGRSPESLYYHIRALMRVSLVEQSGTRTGRGPQEAVYRLCAKRIRVNTEIRTHSFVKTLSRGIKTLLRYAERCYIAALASDATVLQGKVRECRMVQITKRLSERQLIELNRRILELESDLENLPFEQDDSQYVITMVVSPAQRND